MTKLAEKKRISVTKLSGAVKHENGKSFKFMRKSFQISRKKRSERSKHGKSNPILSDEKTFTVVPVVNKQNERVVNLSQEFSKGQKFQSQNIQPLQ